MLHIYRANDLTKEKIKFIKSLGLKKNRIAKNQFILQGEKSICLLLQSSYAITFVVGTPSFLEAHQEILQQKKIAYFQASPAVLASLSTLEQNNSALAVAPIPASHPLHITKQQYGLVLDGIRDPGNVGTIIRIAAWYGLAGIICSSDTVELYNPKVLQASMGSFLHIPVYYTDLLSYLAKAQVPIIGAFTSGQSIHDPAVGWPTGGLLVIGNESWGIRPALLSFIQQRLSIPCYGQAESLNAAVATAVLCDNLIQRCYKASKDGLDGKKLV